MGTSTMGGSDLGEESENTLKLLAKKKGINI